MKKISLFVACVFLMACGEKTAEAVQRVGAATTDLASTATAEASEKIKLEATHIAEKATAEASKKLHEVADRIRQ